MDGKIFTVSELTSELKGLMEGRFPSVWLSGEISNFRPHSSGHFYFCLKDASAQIQAVMFRGANRLLKVKLEDGMEVVGNGRLTVYEPRGSYQIVLEYLEPKGLGALQLAFEQLKQRLEAEGLFKAERKRPLPLLPRRIGIITSPTGAAIRDMIHVLKRRHASVEILLRPVNVQGAEAAPEIAAALAEIGDLEDVDLIIVGRGGGSIEDLWAFNTEIVARAIFTSPVPVISAVGHEIDFTIADFVADLRAPTPSAAAEIAVPRKSELVGQVMDMEEQLARCMWRRLELAKENWRGFVKRLVDPERKLRETQQRVDELSLDLVRRFRDRMRQVKDRFVQGGGRLDALSPLAVLDRGYSIVHKIPEEKLVKDTTSLDLGDFLRVTFAKGKAICRVERKE